MDIPGVLTDVASQIPPLALPSRRLSAIVIVLPPGKAGVIANLAVVLANKVPVNLNFTAGREAVEAAIRIGEISDCITAHAVQKKLPDFPWPAHLLQVDDILPPDAVISAQDRERLIGALRELEPVA